MWSWVTVQSHEETRLGQQTRFGHLSRITQHAKSHKSLHSYQVRRAPGKSQEVTASTSYEPQRERPWLLLANNKSSDQPAHLRSLTSTFVIRYLKSKATRSDISYILFWGGLQRDKISGYAPGNHFRPMTESVFNYIQIVCQNFCVHIYRWCVQRYQWRIYKCHSMHQIKLNEFYYSMYLTCLKTVLWIICSLSDNIISYHHKFRLLYQHITNLQLTHKRENENELNKEEAYSSTSFSR